MLGARRSSAEPAFLVDGRKVRISPQRAIGKGGEADVYDIGGGLALKLFKGPDHPDYAADAEAQRTAAERIDEHQRKLPALLALQHRATRVTWPVALATDRSTGRIAGYAMPIVRPSEVLLRYSDQGFRRGIAAEQVVAILRDLHATVSALHADGIVIGDFNDLNVLVKGEEALVIDADSFQFGSFVSHLFTARFLDPRLASAVQLAPARPHDRQSDWYAFAAMTMQLLLFVDPYGGVHAPKNPADRTPAELRPLHRITVFHPEVRYPRQALPPESLPDDLVQHFVDVFVNDLRMPFPLSLLDGLRWMRCACGLVHARGVCPRCNKVVAQPARQAVVRAGRIDCETIARTRGVFVAARVDGDKLLWLEFLERGGSRAARRPAHPGPSLTLGMTDRPQHSNLFVREDGSVVFEGSLDARMSFALQRRSTWVTRGEQTAAFGDSSRRLIAEAFAVNERHCYRISDGLLMRDDEVIGSVLEGQTRFWVGRTFGFGFYRAGEVSVAFVFPAEGGGLRDTVKLPPIAGQLVDADAVFTDERCWLLLAIESGGRRLHRCVVIRADGTIEAMAEEPPRVGEWLSRIHGNAAAGPFLFVATDLGIIRVDVRGGRVRAESFEESEELVDGGTLLLASARGLVAVTDREIRLLTVHRD